MAKKKAVKKAATPASGDAVTTEKPMKKSVAVRAVLATGVTEVKEVQKLVKEKYGLDVGYQNVYTLLKAGKSSAARKTVKKTKSPKTSSAGVTTQLGSITAGLQFIRVAGGIEEAKAVLRTIDEIRSF